MTTDMQAAFDGAIEEIRSLSKMRAWEVKTACEMVVRRLAALASRPDAQADERGAFEAWVNKEWPGLVIDRAPLMGFYKGDDGALLDDMWCAWRARAAAPQAEAAQGVPVAWQVRRADGRIDGVPIQWEDCTKELYDATLATGRYAGYENGPRCEVRALCVAAPTPDRETCHHCGGTGLVDDGEITGSGGVEYKNGPVKCVKDCPECGGPFPDREQMGEAPEGCTKAAIAQWQQQISCERFAPFSKKKNDMLTELQIETIVAETCGTYRTGDSYTFEDVWNCIEKALAAHSAGAQEPVGHVTHDDANGWDFQPTVDWTVLGKGRALYAQPPAATDAARDVLAERRRQVEVEGWAPEHDDEHDDCEMALAAIVYAESAVGYWTECPDTWPWHPKWFKPTTPRRDLVKAGALILAEIERLDRFAEIERGEKS